MLTALPKDLSLVWHSVPMLRCIPDRLCPEPRLGSWDRWLGIHWHRHRDDDWDLWGAALAQIDQHAPEGPVDGQSATGGDSEGHDRRRHPRSDRAAGFLRDLSPRDHPLGCSNRLWYTVRVWQRP